MEKIDDRRPEFDADAAPGNSGASLVDGSDAPGADGGTVSNQEWPDDLPADAGRRPDEIPIVF